MSLSSAMLVGYTGIQSNSVMVDTVGDNLANVNTTAFKSQRTQFETLLYDTIREGEGPSVTSGGTLPFQTGRGSTVSSVQRSFQQGSLESTAFPSDLAVDGEGFFIVDPGTGASAYTRDGSFHLNADQVLVSSNGAALQVFPADEAGTVDPNRLSNLVIPLGSTGEAVATSEVLLEGRLDSATPIASQAGVLSSQPLVTASGSPAVSDTALTDLVHSSGVPLLATGDSLVIRASKGGLALEDSTFVIGTDGDTVGDFANYLQTAFGLDTDPVTGGGAGVTVADGTTAPAGTLVVASNYGRINELELDQGSIINTNGLISTPFTFTTDAEAVGGGLTTTSFSAFDSLGNPVDVRLRLNMESKSESGTTWRFRAESSGDSDLSPMLGTGTISFDATGRFVGSTGTHLSVDRAGAGAVTPLTFGLDFGSLTGFASTDGTSELVMKNQDGAPAGVMIGYSVDADGIVRGAYSNQQTVVLGQVALATFRNTQGLIATSENSFLPGPNSGEAQVTAPRTSIAGSIASGQLEQSNVEIAREFLNLITASTGITSASRVVRVADELLQELLLVVR